MARIFFNIAKYNPPYQAKNTAQETSANCSRIDLCRCLMTVGNPSFLSWRAIHEFGFTRALYNSIISKFALVISNLRVKNRNICRHPIFDKYVSDQKRIVSYNLGMAIAKYHSEAVFGISNLIHLEFLKKQKAVSLVSDDKRTRSREPDLVGTDMSGHWHLFEAKAVSGSKRQLPNKIADAKQQLSQVSTIRGETPETRTACATYIGIDQIFSQIEDPNGDSDKDIHIPSNQYFDAYYKPFLLATTTEGPECGLHIQEHRIDGIDVVGFHLERGAIELFLGLEAEARSSIQNRHFQLDPSLRLKLDLLSQRKTKSYSVGVDGYFVQRIR